MASGVIKKPLKAYSHTLTNLTFTANTRLELGTISSFTDGACNNYWDTKGIVKSLCGGVTSLDNSAMLYMYSNKVYLTPTTTQNNGYVNFTIFA